MDQGTYKTTLAGCAQGTETPTDQRGRSHRATGRARALYGTNATLRPTGQTVVVLPAVRKRPRGRRAEGSLSAAHQHDTTLHGLPLPPWDKVRPKWPARLMVVSRPPWLECDLPD